MVLDGFETPLISEEEANLRIYEREPAEASSFVMSLAAQDPDATVSVTLRASFPADAALEQSLRAEIVLGDWQAGGEPRAGAIRYDGDFDGDDLTATSGEVIFELKDGRISGKVSGTPEQIDFTFEGNVTASCNPIESEPETSRWDTEFCSRFESLRNR